MHQAIHRVFQVGVAHGFGEVDRGSRFQPGADVVGVNCGGSDGNSGVTANPALGVASDLIVQQGGTSILGETPEIYGAEHVLTRRAVSREVGEKLVERIKWWEWYTGIFGFISNNDRLSKELGNKKPATWDDLLDPAWKGKLVFPDPVKTGGGYIFMATQIFRFNKDEAKTGKIAWNLATVFGSSHPDWSAGLRWGLAVLAALLFFVSVLVFVVYTIPLAPWAIWVAAG